jgi:2-polyprenyl-3-methyl-5-hydroxy-6-metoxy-1,4-benzoquinol methylase
MEDAGRARSAAAWDREDRRGAWQYLEAPEELGYSLAVAECIRRAAAIPAILDPGCGHGRLLELLPPGSFRSYLGIDCSREAVAHPSWLACAHARFRVADLNGWRPRRRFSVIVLSESLNHMRHPVATLRRFRQALEPGGVIVVSLSHHPRYEMSWRRAAQHFETLHRAAVRAGPRRCWDVGVLQPKPVAGPPIGLDPEPASAVECIGSRTATPSCGRLGR